MNNARIKNQPSIVITTNIQDMALATSQWEESIRAALEDLNFKNRRPLSYDIIKGTNGTSKDFSEETKGMKIQELRSYFFKEDALSPKKGMAFNKINKLLNKEIKRRETLGELKELFPLTFTGTIEYNLLIKKIAVKFFKKK